MQAKMVRLTEPKDRFDAIFLSEILLLNNRTVIEQRILDDITTVTAYPYPYPSPAKISCTVFAVLCVCMFECLSVSALQQLNDPRMQDRILMRIR
jgi:hypothetical protein